MDNFMGQGTRAKGQATRFLKIFLFFLFIFTYDLRLTCLAGRLATYDLYAQDKIVAIVNGSAITQKDLNDFINFMRLQLSATLKGEQLESKIQSMKLDLLHKLVDDQLILQEAKRLNLKIDPERIKAKIEEIKKGYDSDVEFQRELAKQGLVQADIETRIREQLLMYHVIEMKVRKKIAVNPAEVTDFYDRNTREFIIPEERELESLIVKDFSLAKEISDSLKEGKELSDLAEKYALKLNTFIVTSHEELKKDIAEVIFKLMPGEVRGPVKIENDYYFFKLNKINPPRQQKLSEAQENIYNFLFEKKMQEGLGRWLEELKERSYVKIIEEN